MNTRHTTHPSYLNRCAPTFILMLASFRLLSSITFTSPGILVFHTRGINSLITGCYSWFCWSLLGTSSQPEDLFELLWPLILPMCSAKFGCKIPTSSDTVGSVMYTTAGCMLGVGVCRLWVAQEPIQPLIDLDVIST